MSEDHQNRASARERIIQIMEGHGIDPHTGAVAADNILEACGKVFYEAK